MQAACNATCDTNLCFLYGLQEGPSGDPTIRKLFGLKLHKSLKADEGDEIIEVGVVGGALQHPAEAC